MTISTADKRAQIDDLRRRMARIPGRLTEHEPELFDGPRPSDIADDETTRRADLTTPSTHADTAGSSTHADESPPARSTTIPATSRNALPAPGPLAELLPHRGIPRGTVTALTGSATILTALIAATTATGQHAAVIGCPRLGLLAAAEHGADLARCAWIPDPGDDPVEIAFSWGSRVVVLRRLRAAPGHLCNGSVGVWLRWHRVRSMGRSVGHADVQGADAIGCRVWDRHR